MLRVININLIVTFNVNVTMRFICHKRGLSTTDKIWIYWFCFPYVHTLLAIVRDLLHLEVLNFAKTDAKHGWFYGARCFFPTIQTINSFGWNVESYCCRMSENSTKLQVQTPWSGNEVSRRFFVSLHNAPGFLK